MKINQATQTLNDVILIKKLNNDILHARALEFIERIKYKQQEYIDNKKMTSKLLKILIEVRNSKTNYNLINIIRKWRRKTEEIIVKENGDIICKYIKNRFIISKARKNWIKLSKLLDLYSNNNMLFELLKKLKEYIILKKFIDLLEKNKKNRNLNDIINALKSAKIDKKTRNTIQIFEERNQVFLLNNYLKKWNDIINKIKDREYALEDALDVINNRKIFYLSKRLNLILYNYKFKNLSNRILDLSFSTQQNNKIIIINKIYKFYYYKKLDSFINFITKIKKQFYLKKLKSYIMNNKFTKLYKRFSELNIIPKKNDFFNLLKANHFYFDDMINSKMKLFKLFRKYFIKFLYKSSLYPNRLLKLSYLIKLTFMHQTILYQRYIREFLRKWRFYSFVQKITKKKMQVVYKNLHISYLQIIDEIFGDQKKKEPSVIKEFQKLCGKMGTFINENYNNPPENNFCNNISKKYSFQNFESYDKEATSLICFSGAIDDIEMNEDYFVDQEIGRPMTEGRYKVDSRRDSKKDNNSINSLNDYSEENYGQNSNIQNDNERIFDFNNSKFLKDLD